MRKTQAFRPTVDGRLEERVVLSTARRPLTAAVARAALAGSAVLTTRTYNQVLVGIHNSIVAYARSNGSDQAYNRFIGSVNRQLYRIPYANRDGLIAAVTGPGGTLGDLFPEDLRNGGAKLYYDDTRVTIQSFIYDEMQAGLVGIRKSGGSTFSDQDIYGHWAFRPQRNGFA